MTSLIIPAYLANRELLETTRHCLRSLRYGRPDETIVVNDGSPISSSNLVAIGADAIIDLQSNHGYSVAVNAGLKAAHGDVLIVGNNDLLFTPGWLAAITLPLEGQYDIVSLPTSDQTYETAPVITIGEKFGSLFAMKRGVYDTLGGFDEQFRGYFADLDYKMRAERALFRIAKNYAVVVEHEAKATYKITDPSDVEFKEAQQLFIQKHGTLL